MVVLGDGPWALGAVYDSPEGGLGRWGRSGVGVDVSKGRFDVRVWSGEGGCVYLG